MEVVPREQPAPVTIVRDEEVLQADPALEHMRL